LQIKVKTLINDAIEIFANIARGAGEAGVMGKQGFYWPQINSGSLNLKQMEIEKIYKKPNFTIKYFSLILRTFSMYFLIKGLKLNISHRIIYFVLIKTTLS